MIRAGALSLAVVFLAGCGGPGARVATQDRHAAYLAELQGSRNRPYGPCMTTYDFLKATGKEGVPTVLKALEQCSGPANVSLRVQIVNGAWHYDKTSGGGNVVLPIMRRASEDPDAKVSKRAKDWLKAKEAKKEAK